VKNKEEEESSAAALGAGKAKVRGESLRSRALRSFFAGSSENRTSAANGGGRSARGKCSERVRSGECEEEEKEEPPHP
jgi:hypothetical protein